MGSFAVEEGLVYPAARRDESVVDNYHGMLVSDPYRWLEDPDAKEVKDFVEKQVQLTQSYIQNCETREKFRKQITTLLDHPRYGCPFRRGNKYFYFFNTGLQAQSVLYVQDSLDAEAEVLLDPNTLSEDGTISLNMYAISEDAEFLAVGLSSSGSDWVNIKVIRIADKTTEPDCL
ncbi:S9 family peptidase, partial [Soehngenia saccharolytica]